MLILHELCNSFKIEGLLVSHFDSLAPMILIPAFQLTLIYLILMAITLIFTIDQVRWHWKCNPIIGVFSKIACKDLRV